MFDSSIFKPKKVFGARNVLMFLDQDEEIWGMGRNFEGPLDEGWIRKIKKPADCHTFKRCRVVEFDEGKSLRMVLTEEGRLFLHGDGYEQIFKLKEDG